MAPEPVRESAFPGSPSNAGTTTTEVFNNNLGVIPQLRGKHGEAIPFFQKAVEIKSGYGLAWMNMIVSYNAISERGKVWDAYQQLAKVDDSRARAAKAKFNIPDQRPADAAPPAVATQRPAPPAQQSAVQESQPPQGQPPAMQPEVSVQKSEQNPSLTASTIGNIQAAQRVVLAEPTNPSAWRALAGQYASTGENEKAIRAYQEALRLEPNNVDTLEALGALYAKSGQKDKVRETWESLAKVDKGRADKFFSAYILP